MRISFILTALVLLGFLLPGADALAQIPQTISYQGVLANADGSLIANGPHRITIRFYDQAAGGNLLYSEQQTVNVVRGIYNLIIGSTTPIPATLGFDKPYFLGISVDDGAEMVPRTAMTTSPYAMHSWIADSLADGLVNSVNGMNGALTISGGPGIAVTKTGNTLAISDTSALNFVGSGATTVTRNGNTVTISSHDTSGGNSGITGVLNLDESITITKPNGPVPLIGVAPLGITTDKLNDEAVTNEKLADISITTRKIADGAVTNPKLASNSVTTDKIVDGTIANADLADNSITSNKIVDATIINADLADNSVTSNKIVDATIINADLADNSVTSSKIVDATIVNADLADNSVTTSKIADGTIINADLANNSVTSANIVDATIVNADLADNSVTTSKIAPQAVTLDKITTTGATAGQAPIFDGTTLTYGNPAAGSFVVPFAQTATVAVPMFALTNNGTGDAGDFMVTNATSAATALSGSTNGTGVGVLGVHSAATGTAAGVRGESNSIDANAVAVSGVINSTTPGGFSAGVRGINNGTGGLGIGVYGSQAGSGWGVYGTAPGGIGVYGNSTNGFGLYGLSTSGTGIMGNSTNGSAGVFQITNSANNSDVLSGSTSGGGTAISGTSSGNGHAALFQLNNASNSASVVQVGHDGIGNGITVQLTNASNGARGVDVTQAGVGPGVFATSAGGNALWGITSSISAAGVIGDNTFGEAVVGRNRGGVGVGAVVGRNDSSGYGVRGFNTQDGIGVLGQAGISGGTGTAGRFENVNAANTNSAVQVANNGIGNGITIQLTNASNGARGVDVTQSGVGPGVFATSAGGNALWGITSSISAAGVIGDNTFGEAVVGRNRGGVGVGAVVGRNDSSGYGVRGFNTKDGIGVLGQAGISGGTGTAGRFENVNAANTSDALQVVTNSSGNAARFTGNVVVNGNLTVSGNVAKGGGTFMIDHPLDPQNKILYHSFVESPDMKNIYDGVAMLDGNGEAVVELPDWFMALNGDYRYQLTAIGAPGPNLYIADKIKENHFKIAGGKPGTEVSWQVTGIRHDPYAEKHPMQVEVEKSAADRGTYIHPEAYGASAGKLPVMPSPSTVSLQSTQGATQQTPAARAAVSTPTATATASSQPTRTGAENRVTAPKR